MAEAEQSDPDTEAKVSSPDSDPASSAGPPTPTASVEKTKAKPSVEVKVAVIAAFAALIGALVGAMVTGHYTATTVDRQIAAQVEQGLRQQRQVLYIQLIQDEEALRQAEIKYWNIFRNNVSRSYPPLEQIRERKTDIEMAQANYDLSSSTVSLIGASDTSDQVSELNAAHDDFYITVDYAFSLAPTNASVKQSQEVDDTFDSTADSLIEAHESLLRLLRRDLAIN